MPAVKNVKHLTMRNEKLLTRFGEIELDEAGNAVNLDELGTTADAVLSNVPGFVDADIFGEIKDTAAKPVVMLKGSANQPGNIPLGNGESVLQTDLVRMAYKESGMSEEDWNALPEVEREDKIGQQVTKLRERKEPEPMVDTSPDPRSGNKLARGATTRGQITVTPEDDEAARASRSSGYATNQVQGPHEEAALPHEWSRAAGVQEGQSLINKDEFPNPPASDREDNSDPNFTGFMETGTQVRKDEPRDPPPQPGDPDYNDTGKQEGTIASQDAGSNFPAPGDGGEDAAKDETKADDPASQDTQAEAAKSETKEASDEDVKKIIDENRKGNENSEGYIEIDVLNKKLKEAGFKSITGKRRKEIEDAAKK